MDKEVTIANPFGGSTSVDGDGIETVLSEEEISKNAGEDSVTSGPDDLDDRRQDGTDDSEAEGKSQDDEQDQYDDRDGRDSADSDSDADSGDSNSDDIPPAADPATPTDTKPKESRAARRIREQAKQLSDANARLAEFESEIEALKNGAHKDPAEPNDGQPRDELGRYTKSDEPIEWTEADIERVMDGGLTPEEIRDRALKEQAVQSAKGNTQPAEDTQYKQQMAEQQRVFQGAGEYILNEASIAQDLPEDWDKVVLSQNNPNAVLPGPVLVGAAERPSRDSAKILYAIAKDTDFQNKLLAMNMDQQRHAALNYKPDPSTVAVSRSKAPKPLKTAPGTTANTRSKFDMSFEELENATRRKQSSNPFE